MTVRSATAFVGFGTTTVSWPRELADKIDKAVEELGEGRDVISVTTSPIQESSMVPTLHDASPATRTTFVMVTVVWREP